MSWRHTDEGNARTWYQSPVDGAVPYTRMPPDSNDVRHAVIHALSDGCPGMSRSDLIAIPHLGPGASRMIVDDVIARVRSGILVLVYRNRRWDHDEGAWRYPEPPRLIPADEVAHYGAMIGEPGT